jgi:formylmethanofuran dehydrogenase subunit C
MMDTRKKLPETTMLTLTIKDAPAVPLEAENISPDVIAPLPLAAVRSLPVFLGKRQLRLDEAFTIDGEPSDSLELRGDCSKVKWIGRGMTRGQIRITGNAGMHLGAHMKAGTITVQGNVSDWLGGEMKGGHIHIHGNSGGQVGAAYRGSVSGMSGGMILIEGTTGLEVGMRMKKGTIAIRGRARDFVGLQMKGGTIVLMTGAEIRAGAWMTRGTIISLEPLQMLPTFHHACDYQPTFLRLYAKSLAAHGFTIPTDGYRRYTGDSSGIGKGEILVRNGV